MGDGFNDGTATAPGTAAERTGGHGAGDLLGCVPVVAAYFQKIMGLDFEFHPAPDVGPGAGPFGANQRTRNYRPGPVPRAEGDLVARRWRSPLARLHRAVMLSEIFLLPLCAAHTPAERDRYHDEIGCVLALDRAVEARWITGWTVCWPAGGYPKMPTCVRLRADGPPGARERALGELAPWLRDWVDNMKAVQLGGTREGADARRRLSVPARPPG